MRVIAGEHRGRSLQAPRTERTRPTPDRVREALFSALEVWLGGPGAIRGLRVLDLFAGSGALGIEALSRGAEHTTFVEREPEAIEALRHNLERLDLLDRSEIARGSAMPTLARLVNQGVKFDVALLDPPFSSPAGALAMESLLDGDLLRLGGVVVLEHPSDQPITPLPGLRELRTRRYGGVALTFLRRENQLQNPKEAPEESST